MAFLHYVRCPKCDHSANICTSDEDGYAFGTRFQYTCPNCVRKIAFPSQAVEILDGEGCPSGSVIGELYELSA